VYKVFAWTLIAALSVVLIILSVPFLDGVPLLAVLAVSGPWKPWGIVFWLFLLLLSLAPVISVWLIFRSGRAKMT
jgi:hypothetical protein